MSQLLQRAYYQATAREFIASDPHAILGQLVNAHGFATDNLQRAAWQHQILSLKPVVVGLSEATVLFEFSIPRMGKRADVILLHRGLVFVIEYKVGEQDYPQYAQDQALDYATDLSFSERINPCRIGILHPHRFFQI